MHHISTTDYLLKKQILPQQKYMGVARAGLPQIHRPFLQVLGSEAAKYV